jgi:nucleoside-diphosphate-sugar epimerase
MIAEENGVQGALLMKRVLITGGMGFVGAWVVKHLLGSSVKIRVLDLSSRGSAIIELVLGGTADQVEWMSGDITDGQVATEAAAGCDAIIHLAALQLPACRNDPVLGAQVNVIGTLNIFEAAKKNGIPSITYMSTASVFGPDDGTIPNPATHYGTFKLANEGSARSYWHDAGIASVGLRPFVLYGPGRDAGLSAGISLACRAAALGEPYTIGFVGRADFVYVEDVAKALIAATSLPPEGPRVFTLPGEVASVDEIVKEIRAIAPSANITCQGKPNPSISESSGLDLRLMIPDIPKTSLRNGLRSTIDRYLANKFVLV